MPTFNRTMLAGERLPFVADTSQRVVGEWQPNALYEPSMMVRPTDLKETGFWYQTAAIGQSGVKEPTWATPVGSITQDGSLVWTAVVPPASGPDSIASVTWTQISPPDGALTISGQSNDTLTFTVFLGGGTSGLIYTVEGIATMVSGAIHIAKISLTVQ